MIPKIIHYVWLGDEPIKGKMKMCIDSWHKIMPGYEIRRWGDAQARAIKCRFVDEAIAEKKWAFASDVIRLYALYLYGGIYFDTDVLALKPFDPFLAEKAFMGSENSLHIVGHSTLRYLTTCCMGAERGNPFIARCLKYYKDRSFITSPDMSLPPELRLDLRLNSEVMCRLARDMGYDPSALKNSVQRCRDLTVYPSDYFDPACWTPHSYCQHLALGSWRDTPTKEENYTLSYKVQWRIWAMVEKILAKYNRKIIKLN